MGIDYFDEKGWPTPKYRDYVRYQIEDTLGGPMVRMIEPELTYILSKIIARALKDAYNEGNMRAMSHQISMQSEYSKLMLESAIAGVKLNE